MHPPLAPLPPPPAPAGQLESDDFEEEYDSLTAGLVTRLPGLSALEHLNYVGWAPPQLIYALASVPGLRSLAMASSVEEDGDRALAAVARMKPGLWPNLEVRGAARRGAASAGTPPASRPSRRELGQGARAPRSFVARGRGPSELAGLDGAVCMCLRGRRRPSLAPRAPPQGLYFNDITEEAMEALAALELPSLRHFEAAATNGAWLARLAAAPWLPRLETLTVDGFSLARGSLAGVALPRLEALKLGGPGVWLDAAKATLLAALALPRLTMLTVEVLWAHDVAALSRAAWWPRLQDLVITLAADDDGGLDAVRALVGRPLPRLYTLTVHSAPLCAEALRVLAAAELPRLNEFALGVQGVEEEEEASRCIDASRAILEAAPWRRRCGDCFTVSRRTFT
jgi:hypothetical protein